MIEVILRRLLVEVDVKGSFDEDSERSEQICRESSCLREYIYYQEQNVATGMKVKVLLVRSQWK